MMIHNHSENYEQDRRWVAAGLLRLRHCLQPHHHPYDGGAGHHQSPVYKVQSSTMGCRRECWFHQALTDPTVKHECSPEPIADNLDYYVTYRWQHCHHLYHNYGRIQQVSWYCYPCYKQLSILHRNKVAALAEQYKQDKPNNGLWVPNCIYHVSQGK